VSEPRYDLKITAGRVFCDATGLDGPGAVAVSGGRVAVSGGGVSGDGRRELDFPDCLLLPGFVDMHAHPAPSDWKYGMDPDTEVLPRGSTTVLSQGDAGPANWPEYLDTVVKPARTRIRMAISPARTGEEDEGFVFREMSDVDVDACAAAIEDGGEHIWGIAVNISGAGTGPNDPKEIMRRALAAAERTGRPLLFGPRREPGDWPLGEQLALLRPGDVVTYCFHRTGGLLDERGRVISAARSARERGVLFDVGHGMASFDFGVAEAAFAQGFPPDTISTDFYKRHVGLTPVHDMPRTISKLMAAGLAETDALTRATRAPASALGLAGEVGTLAPGSCADLAVVRWNPEAPPLADVSGVTRPGGCWEPILTVRGGEAIERRTAANLRNTDKEA
jgi:dihydroorotase